MPVNPYEPPKEVNEPRAPVAVETTLLDRVAWLFLWLFVAYICLGIIHGIWFSLYYGPQLR